MTFLADSPCTQCGWKFKSFHVCVDLSGDEPTPVARPRRKTQARSKQHLDALNEGRSLRWERYHEENRERDEKIVKRYNEGGIGATALGKEFGMSPSTVLKVLRRAQDEGHVQIRPVGRTLAKGAQ